MWKQAQLFRDRLANGATAYWDMDVPADAERELLHLQAILDKAIAAVHDAHEVHSAAEVSVCSLERLCLPAHGTIDIHDVRVIVFLTRCTERTYALATFPHM